MPVITISGATGSGAREVGRRVAATLGIDFVDQQLMVQAARRCGVPIGAVAEHDERCRDVPAAHLVGDQLDAGALGCDRRGPGVWWGWHRSHALSDVR